MRFLPDDHPYEAEALNAFGLTEAQLPPGAAPRPGKAGQRPMARPHARRSPLLPDVRSFGAQLQATDEDPGECPPDWDAWNDLFPPECPTDPGGWGWDDLFPPECPTGPDEPPDTGTCPVGPDTGVCPDGDTGGSSGGTSGNDPWREFVENLGLVFLMEGGLESPRPDTGGRVDTGEDGGTTDTDTGQNDTSPIPPLGGGETGPFIPW